MSSAFFDQINDELSEQTFSQELLGRGREQRQLPLERTGDGSIDWDMGLGESQWSELGIGLGESQLAQSGRVANAIDKTTDADSTSRTDERRKVGAIPTGKKNRDPRSRGWVFTAHVDKAFTDEELHHAISTAGTTLELRYCIAGLEIAPSTGRLHYQGYLYRGGKLSFNQVSKCLDSCFSVHCYLAAARGDHEQNRDYCTKDGKYAEYGTLPRAGNRSDLAVIARMIDNGSTMKDVALSNPASYIRYHGGLNVCFAF